MEVNEGVTVLEHNVGSRKRSRSDVNAKIAKKNERYAPADPNLLRWEIPCGHNKKQNYQCREIDINTLKLAKHYVYADNSKNNQNIRLASLLKVTKPVRNRKRNAAISKPHDFQIRYSVGAKAEYYVVCRAFFLKLFEVKPRRVLLVASKTLKGESVGDHSGGDRRSQKQLPKFVRVKEFIGKFRAQESHYNRNKSKRLYLHSSLTIRKMWKMYNDEADAEFQVKYCYFHKIFSTQFNLGFGSPATDVCSYCERTKFRIKNNPTDDDAKRDLKVHQVKAKQFNLLMKEKRDNEVTYCFDLQQVQNLPKIPIQETFYSLQIAYYCFCVVDVDARTPNFYVWTENVGGRGSNEVGSALLHFLRHTQFNESVTKIRLFCDGCGGQNKNSHILHMLMYWLHKESQMHIKEIEIIFPVRGHSYLPADRVFGRVEKELRRHDRIILPSDYTEIYKNFGNVFELEKDWRVYDLKSLLTVFNKYDGISEQKVVHLKKTLSRGKKQNEVSIVSQVFYRNEDPSKKEKTLLKRGKSLANVSLRPLTDHHKISADKGKAVNNLLVAAFGENWRLEESLRWYFELLLSDFRDDAQINHDDQMNCDCVQEEPELKT